MVHETPLQRTDVRQINLNFDFKTLQTNNLLTQGECPRNVVCVTISGQHSTYQWVHLGHLLSLCYIRTPMVGKDQATWTYPISAENINREGRGTSSDITSQNQASRIRDAAENSCLLYKNVVPNRQNRQRPNVPWEKGEAHIQIYTYYGMLGCCWRECCRWMCTAWKLFTT